MSLDLEMKGQVLCAPLLGTTDRDSRELTLIVILILQWLLPVFSSAGSYITKLGKIFL